jgi:predicted DNA-binding protein YlxM (UPF0122 family)
MPTTSHAPDCVSLKELAEALNVPVSALTVAVEKNRKTIKKPYYSIPELAVRWNCSRATVYNILKESELKMLNLSRENRKKGKWNVPALVVEHIERARMEKLPENIAA